MKTATFQASFEEFYGSAPITTIPPVERVIGENSPGLILVVILIIVIVTVALVIYHSKKDSQDYVILSVKGGSAK